MTHHFPLSWPWEVQGNQSPKQDGFETGILECAIIRSGELILHGTDVDSNCENERELQECILLVFIQAKSLANVARITRTFLIRRFLATLNLEAIIACSLVRKLMTQLHSAIRSPKHVTAITTRSHHSPLAMDTADSVVRSLESPLSPAVIAMHTDYGTQLLLFVFYRHRSKIGDDRWVE